MSSYWRKFNFSFVWQQNIKGGKGQHDNREEESQKQHGIWGVLLRLYCHFVGRLFRLNLPLFFMIFLFLFFFFFFVVELCLLIESTSITQLQNTILHHYVEFYILRNNHLVRFEKEPKWVKSLPPNNNFVKCVKYTISF